jgi:TPR repeat protein
LAAVFPALADFAAGLAAYQKGDYTTAAQEWRPLAEQGDPVDQYNLGLLYIDGQGVPQDYGEAVKWFRRSAEQGYAPAQHNLGAMYGAGDGIKRDYVQAYKWLNLCAAQGNAGCVTQRDLVSKKLKPSRLSEAQKLSTEFAPKKESESHKEADKQ